MVEMQHFSLKFKNNDLEKEYEQSKQIYNMYGFNVIFTFNTVLIIILVLISLNSENILQFSFTLLSLFLILLTFPLMRNQKFRSLFSDYVIMYLILFPYFSGVYFFIEALTSNIEGFAGGFVFNMYLSFPIRVRLNWYKKLCIHMPAYLLIEIIYYMKDQKINFAFVAMFTIMALNLIFDFYQDKVERKNFLLEHYFKKQKETFQKLFTNVIPEEILIWNSRGLDFANKSALDLFEVQTTRELEPLLLKNIEIQEPTENLLSGISTKIPSCKIPIITREKNGFLEKIREILGMHNTKENDFFSYTAKITLPAVTKKNSGLHIKKPTIFGDVQINTRKRQEFDIKMRKFFWNQEEESVLIILNAVNERNLKSRLEFVNSYLNYLLANLSHEIYTPLNGLLGMLEVSIANLRNNPLIRENLIVAKNSADFLLMITQDLFDFYNIRRGKLLVSISRISLQIFIKELLLIFSSSFSKDNISIESKLESNIIHSDPQKLKQMIVGIINYIIQKTSHPKLFVTLKPTSKKNNILIEIRGTGPTSSPIKILDRWGSYTALRVSRRLTYDRRMIFKECRTPRTPLFSDFLGNGTGEFELHLIKYLALSLAPNEETPFLKHENKKEDEKEIELVYQIVLSDVQENSIIQIEDLSKDGIAFEAEYRLDFDEFLDEKLGNSPLLNWIQTKSENEVSEEEQNPNLEWIEMKSPEKMKESLNSPFYLNFDICSSEFKEQKEEEKRPGFGIEKHPTLRKFKRHSCSLPSESKTKKLPSPENMFSDATGDSPKSPKKSVKNPIILNVDDNAINLMVISNYCKIFEFTVFEAANGFEAVEKAKDLYKKKEECFDLIFMDCDMPVMDGFKACEKILEFYERNKEMGPAIIAITANDTYEDRMKAKKCGMVELVKKPLIKHKFEELVGFWMSKREKTLH